MIVIWRLMLGFVRSATCVGLAALAVAACGGNDPVTVVDAAVDAAPDAPACPVGEMMCTTGCIDTTENEAACGSCTTTCTGGKACLASVCACPPAFVPADPQFVQVMMVNQLGVSAGAGGILNGTIDALVVGFPNTLAAVIDTDYPVDGTVAQPFASAGYDLDLGTLTPAAAFFATSGTLRFTRICRDADTNLTGLAGTLSNATFAAVGGLMNPTPLPGGCTFVAPTAVTFSYGPAPCP